MAAARQKRMVRAADAMRVTVDGPFYVIVSKKGKDGWIVVECPALRPPRSWPTTRRWRTRASLEDPRAGRTVSHEEVGRRLGL